MTTTTEFEVPQCWVDATDVLNSGVNRLLLYGPSGTGKTYRSSHVNAPNGAFKLMCAQDMSTGDVIGSYVPLGEDENRNTVWGWKNGALTEGLINDARVVIDEVDLASGDVLSVLQALTDSQSSIEFKHPATGEVLRPNGNYSVVLTTNVEDPSIALPSALLDRFPIAIRIDSIHPEALEELPEQYRAAAFGVIGKSEGVSIRKFHALVGLEQSGMTRKRAARLAFGDAIAEVVLDALCIDAVEDAA